MADFMTEYAETLEDKAGTGGTVIATPGTLMLELP
jgi:hypothetical protein